MEIAEALTIMRTVMCATCPMTEDRQRCRKTDCGIAQKMIIEALGGSIYFEEDEIFILSAEEYEKYKSNIPHINTWWWQRSPGNYSSYAAYVDSDGTVFARGRSVGNDEGGVRPALRVEEREVGKRIVRYDFPWIVIGEGLAIAEVPIAFRRFDAESNDYGKSEVRQFLLDWVKERSDE